MITVIRDCELAEELIAERRARGADHHDEVWERAEIRDTYWLGEPDFLVEVEAVVAIPSQASDV